MIWTLTKRCVVSFSFYWILFNFNHGNAHERSFNPSLYFLSLFWSAVYQWSLKYSDLHPSINRKHFLAFVMFETPRLPLETWVIIRALIYRAAQRERARWSTCDAEKNWGEYDFEGNWKKPRFWVVQFVWPFFSIFLVLEWFKWQNG